MNITSLPVETSLPTTAGSNRTASDGTDFAQLLTGMVGDAQGEQQKMSGSQEFERSAGQPEGLGAESAARIANAIRAAHVSQPDGKGQSAGATGRDLSGRIAPGEATTHTTMPSELLPMTGFAQGRLSYLARSEYDALNELKGVSGRGSAFSLESLAPSSLREVVQSTSRAAEASGVFLLGEFELAEAATEAATADTQEMAALPRSFEQLDPILRRRISVMRNEQAFQVRVRDYRLTDSQRNELIKSVVSALGREEIGRVRITVNGQDCSPLAAALIRHEDYAHAD